MSTYVPLSTVTLTADTESIVFSGIPQTYNDLIIVIRENTASGSNEHGIQFNADTSSSYSATQMWGNGTSAVSVRTTSAIKINIGGNVANQTIIQIQSYSNSTTFKSTLSRFQQTASGQQVVATGVGVWRKTEPITSITLSTFGAANNYLYKSGTTFTLYGIGEGSPKAFGGDVVVNDGTYWYHAFRSSGVFAPTQSLSADILVIAGGGGGGEQIGAGGGAGGLLYHSAQSLGMQNYTITVGAGGTSTQTFGVSNPGTNSQFGSLTASVGGGGGAHGNDGSGGVGYNGGNGGSGGGASQNNLSTSYTGGTATTGQGNRGGNASRSGGYANGGGGGAGVAGTDSTSTIGVAGGNGLSTYSSWGSITNTGQNISGTYWYAGGGGSGTGFSTGTAGGSGGNGGGGNGGGGTSSASGSIAGLANTGGGGGGGGQRSGDRGSSGGSGIVIVRYAV